MAQSKEDKQRTALNILIRYLYECKVYRQHLQNQSYKVIPPTQEELNASQEAYNLRVKLGLIQDFEPVF